MLSFRDALRRVIIGDAQGESVIIVIRLFVLVLFSMLLTFLAMPRALTAELPRRALLGAGVVDKDGVRISFIRPGSAAERAGMRAGDVVLAVADHAVHDSRGFIALVKSQAAGRPILFHLLRNGAPLPLAVTLATAPKETDALVDTLYQSVEVDGTLRRTLLTVPHGSRLRKPAVLILGGIGCYSIDDATDREDAYMRIAHDLGRRGIVVMRLEKSGIGDSQGPPCMTRDFASEMHSYAVALDFLAHAPQVDPQSLWLFGHSIGTLMAPRLALTHKIAGAIIAEGVGRNWFEYELENLRRQLVLAGDDPATIDAKLASKEMCMHRLLIAKEDEAVIERSDAACREHNAYPAPAAYMQEAAALNVAEPWTKYALPLLAIYGTADFITSEPDHRRIVDIVNAKHPGAATLRVIAGMDHHLDVGRTPQLDYDLRVKNNGSAPYDSELSAVVADWLCRHARCAVG